MASSNAQGSTKDCARRQITIFLDRCQQSMNFCQSMLSVFLTVSRENGDAPPVRACQAECAVSVGCGLPTDGRWPQT
eukprot:6328564-Pyramimonas_sp.AAC.1